jgi:hypothetical protein
MKNYKYSYKLRSQRGRIKYVSVMAGDAESARDALLKKGYDISYGHWIVDKLNIERV